MRSRCARLNRLSGKPVVLRKRMEAVPPHGCRCAAQPSLVLALEYQLKQDYAGYEGFAVVADGVDVRLGFFARTTVANVDRFASSRGVLDCQIHLHTAFSCLHYQRQPDGNGAFGWYLVGVSNRGICG